MPRTAAATRRRTSQLQAVRRPVGACTPCLHHGIVMALSVSARSLNVRDLTHAYVAGSFQAHVGTATQQILTTPGAEWNGARSGRGGGGYDGYSGAYRGECGDCAGRGLSLTPLATHLGSLSCRRIILPHDASERARHGSGRTWLTGPYSIGRHPPASTAS